ncbi:hypothetical protein NKH71_25380, partial [Mesorhizobium sp. M0983]|uniref:hypothetical protein n=1 Tax=Mesorhizobium sp. M0983 TaxID=2957040 RepID=UPI00333D0825
AAGKQLVQKFLLNSHAMILSFPSSWPRAQNSRQSAVGRRSDQRTGDGLDCTANDRISHVVTASCRSERGTANTPNYSALFRVGAARQS